MRIRVVTKSRDFAATVFLKHLPSRWNGAGTVTVGKPSYFFDANRSPKTLKNCDPSHVGVDEKSIQDLAGKPLDHFHEAEDIITCMPLPEELKEEQIR